MLELDNVSRRFGESVALAEVSLTTPAGQTTVLIGPSGCGKSTMVRSMNGLVIPDAGTVRFEGAALDELDMLEVRRRIGYVIQSGGLFAHMTARENISIVARHLGWSRERIDARIDELVELTHFPSGGLGRYPGTLSGGQRQRVGLMRALMLDPDVLLLDEPLGALDPLIRAELQEQLREIFRSLGKTVVLVTHDMSEAAYFADLIVLMRGGAIVQRGTLEELLEAPAEPFVEEFIGAQRRTMSFEGSGGGGRS
jgi:osmoprotectant transport system ATP-binding protein